MQARIRIPQLLVLAAICFAIYGPAWLPRNTFAGMDFLNLLYPQAFLVKKALAAGEIPLWNWYTWNGSPLLAAMQSAPLYPPMWLTLLFPIPTALQFNVFAHLLFGGFGAILLAERMLSVQPRFSIVAGAVYAGSGFLFGHLEQVNSMAAMSWAPWILLFSHDLLHSRRLPLSVAGACAIALLAGHPQHVVLAVFFAEIYALSWLATSHALAFPDRLKRFAILQCAFAFAGALAAAQLLPTHELSSLSERVWPYDDPNEPALKWRYLVGLFIPRFFNTVAGSPAQPLGYSELGLYTSITGCILALIGIAIAAKCRRAHLPLLAVLILSLLYALGRSGLVTSAAYTLIPFLGQSRGAARALNIFILLMAGLSALGAQWCIRRLSYAKMHRIIVVLIVLLITLDYTLTHRTELKHRLVNSGIPSLAYPGKHVKPLDETGPNRLYRFMMHDSDFYLDSRQTGVAQRLRRLQPNMNLLWGIATIDGYEEGLLPPRHLANFLRRYNRNLRFATPDGALLGMLGSSQMMTDLPQISYDAADKAAERDELTFWKDGPSGSWFLDAAALPTLPETESYWTTSLRGAYPHDAPAQTARPHPFQQVNRQAFTTAASASRIQVSQVRTNSLDLNLAPGPPQKELLLQTWFPGWKLKLPEGPTILGQPTAPILSAWDMPSIATPTPARLIYEPFSFRLGLFLSLAALMIAVISTSSHFTRRVVST